MYENDAFSDDYSTITMLVAPKELSIAYDDYLNSRWSSLNYGRLAKELWRDKIELAGAIAQFIDGVGCSGCLERVVAPQGLAEFLEEEDVPTTQTAELKLFSDKISAVSTTAPVLAKRRTGQTLEDVLWGHLRGLTDSRHSTHEGRVHICVVVQGDDNPLPSLQARYNEIRNDIKSGQPAAHSQSRANIVVELEKAAIKLAQPLLIDNSERSFAAVDGKPPATMFLEQELLAEKVTWRERFRQLVYRGIIPRTMLFIGVLVTTIAVWDVLNAQNDDAFSSTLSFLQLVFGNISNFTGVIDASAVIVLATSLAILSINRLLPNAFKIDLGRTPKFLKRFFEGEAPPKFEAPDDAGKLPKSWHKWIERRLYGTRFSGVGLSAIFAHDAYAWEPQDKQALKQVIEMRPNDQDLLVVIHVPDLASVYEAAIEPLIQSDEWGVSFTEKDELSVLYMNEDTSVEFDGTGSDEVEDKDLGRLLDWRNDEELSTRVADLVNPDFTANDVLPILVLGSTPAAPFELKHVKSEDIARFREEILEEVSPYRVLFEDSGDVSDAALERLESRMKNSISTSNAELHDPETKRLTARYAGRPYFRKTMSGLLQSLFKQRNADSDEYQFRLLACGELHHLLRALAVLSEPFVEGQKTESSSLRATLRSASVLFVERTTAGDMAGRGPLEQIWRQVLGKLDERKIPISAYADVADVMLHLLKPASVFAPQIWSPSNICNDFHLWQRGGASAVELTGTYQGALQAEVKGSLSRLTNLDETYALNQLSQWFEGKWAPAKSVLMIRATTALAENEMLPLQSFEQLLADQSDPEHVLTLIKNHRELGSIIVNRTIMVAHKQLQQQNTMQEKMTERKTFGKMLANLVGLGGIEPDVKKRSVRFLLSQKEARGVLDVALSGELQKFALQLTIDSKGPRSTDKLRIPTPSVQL